MKTIGIDVGGTKILGILFDFKKNKILRSIKLSTSLEKEKFVSQILQIIEELSRDEDVKEVGIGLPGILDRKKGIVIEMPNIPEVKNLKISEMINKKFGFAVKLENDAKCLTIAEHLYGQARGKKNFVVLAIGTGLGGGTYIEGKLYLGNGSAGEFGHINIIPDGRVCGCGNTGCLEEYSSGKAVRKIAKEMGFKTNDPKEIEMLARKGDKKAIKIYEDFGKNLGIGINTIMKILDPELIIVGGSLANAEDLFMPHCTNEINKRVFFSHCKIKVSKLKNGAAIGAAGLFERK